MRQSGFVVAMALVGGCTSNGGSGPTCEPGLTPVTLEASEVVGDYAHLTLRYSGGCKDHTFAVWSSGLGAASDPPQIPLELQHYANGDMCEALLTSEVWVDLSELNLAGGNRAIVSFIMGTGGTGQTLGSVDYTRATSPVAAPSGATVLALDETCTALQY